MSAGESGTVCVNQLCIISHSAHIAKLSKCLDYCHRHLHLSGNAKNMLRKNEKKKLQTIKTDYKHQGWQK